MIELSAPPGRPALARSIAHWIRDTDDLVLDSRVVEKAKLCLLDMIGVAAAASDLPWSRQAAGYAAAMGGGQATLIGSRERASVAEAAFANATTAHGLVQEDMHTASVSHIGVVVWPTLLALAEMERAPGRAFIAAGVVGYQVMARVGQALITQALAQRFRPTGLIGAIGGTAAGARLLQLSEDETVSALALAANTAGGLNEWPHAGGGEMFFHPGFAARNAVTSLLLARAGAEASESSLDGPAGLFAAYGAAPPATLALGGDGEILAAYHKPVPACNYAQTPAQAALALRSAHAFAPREVEQIVVRSFPEAIAYPGCDHAGPYRTQLQAKMSIQFAVAAVLVHGRLDDEVFRAFAEGGEVTELVRRVRLESDGELACGYPQRQGAEVIVTLRDGRTVSRRLLELEPLDAAGVRRRTRAALGRLLGEARAAEVERAIDAITACPDAARIARLLARD